MNRIIDFIKGLLKLAFSGITAFFAVCGAAEMIPIYLPWYKELGDVNIGLGIAYFLAVLLLVNIGLQYYKEATKKK